MMAAKRGANIGAEPKFTAPRGEAREPGCW